MYRYFTQKKATSYNLTGWVRNAPHGKVEGEAQGEENGIQKLLTDLKRGPTHAHVVKLEKEEIPIVDGESGFDVRA
jgi:acylphosphatase